MPGIHATLSASSAKRWLSCTPSARLEQKLRERFGDKSSPYAEEGTKAHAVAELKLRKLNGEINDFNYKEQRKTLGEVPAEMDRYTDIYVDTVAEKLFAARASDPDAKLFIEQRLDFSPWVPGGFGTGDAVIVSDQTLEVCDLKYGKGVPVSAEENPQARLYGLGAIHMFGSVYDFSHVRNTIIQPRLDSISEETMTRDELLAWGEELKPVAQLAWEGKGEFVTGDHCKFCAARAICAKRASEALSIVRFGFDTPGVISDDDIPGILAVADVAEGWIKDIKEYAKNQALNGQRFFGWKLVRGRRGARTFTDEARVREQLNRAGFENEVINKSGLKSPAEIEKVIGKNAFEALVGQFVTQAQGSLELAPESDKRPEYAAADADFGDMSDIGKE